MIKIKYYKGEVENDGCEDCKSDKCYFCDFDDTLTDTHYEDKLINVCYLCNILINNKKEYVNMCVLGHSEKLSQKEIVKKSREYYFENGSIPFPEQLDPDVKMVNLPVYIYSQFEDKFNNFCVFFTANVQEHIENEITMAFKVSKRKNPIMKYYNFPDYIFTNEELKIVEKEKDKIKNKIFSKMKKMEDKFTEKYKYIGLKL